MKIDKALAIEGWMTPNELVRLADLVKDKRVTFEIGSYKGRSTRVLGDNSIGKVYAIDGWNTPNTDANGVLLYNTSEETFREFERNLDDLIFANRVIPIKKNWEDFVPGKKADFIFIDANHSYEAVKRDILKAFEHINSGGVIAGHDFNWPGVQRAVLELAAPRPLSLCDTLWSFEYVTN